MAGIIEDESELEVHDAKNGRFYELDGEYYPSVTSILGDVVPMGEGFYRWLCSFPTYEDAMAERDDKADKGTRVHESCEELLDGNTVDVSDFNRTTIKKIQGFVKFWDAKNPELIGNEIPVVSEIHNYAGRFDLLVKINGEIWLIDIKTSKRVYDKHKLQLMMYKKVLDDNLGRKVNKIGVLLLKSRTNKGWQLKEVEYRRNLINYIMNLYDYLSGDWKPKWKEELPDEISLYEDNKS